MIMIKLVEILDRQASEKKKNLRLHMATDTAQLL